MSEKIQDVYKNLFGDALEKYNQKQKRNDRKIPDYYEKIRTSKQEKLFYEVIIQVGDFEDMNATSDNGKLAEKILDRYMQDFKIRNPNLYVFSAHLHMDEATPHLHIDFIPFSTNNARGLETKNSLKGALESQGFKGGTKQNSELNQWQDAEKEVVAKIMLEHNIEWDKRGGGQTHKTVDKFKADKLAEKVAGLDKQLVEVSREIKKVNSINYKLAELENITTKPVPLSTNKVIISKKDFTNLQNFSKKYVANVDMNKKLKSQLKTVINEKNQLLNENKSLNNELFGFKSVINKLKGFDAQARINELESTLSKIMKFVESLNLKLQLEQYLNKQKDKKGR